MPNRQRTLVVSIALFVAVCLAYCAVWRFEFVHYDDNNHIFTNPRVNSGLTADNVRWAFGQFNGAQWVPLTWVSFMIDVSVFGLNPGAMHGVNVFFHALNAVLLFVLLSRMTSELWSAALVAALFALHPINAESVAWVSERKNVLSTFFWLLSTLSYFRYTQSLRRAWLAASFIALALGLMVKAMLVTLPFTLLLIDVWPLARHRTTSWMRLVVEKIPLFILAIGASVLQMRAAVSDGLLWEGGDAPTFSYRLLNAGANILHYLQMLVVPTDYAPMLPLPQTAPLALGIAGWTFTAIVLAAGWRFRKTVPFVLTGFLWFLGTQVPVSGIIGAGDAVLCDRYMYVPQIGIWIALVWSLQTATRKMSRESLATAVGVVLAILGVVTFQTAGHWKNSTALFQQAAAVSPQSIVAQKLAGWSLARDGRLRESLEAYNAVIKLAPMHAEARTSRAIVLGRLGQNAAAISEFRAVLAADPGNSEARLNLATQLFATGAIAEARTTLDGFKQPAELAATVEYWRARIADADGRRAEALQHYATALTRAKDEGWKFDASERIK